MNLSLFTIDQAQIEAAMSRLEPEPNVANMKITLSADQCLEQKFIDQYECRVCLYVVIKPEQCSECDKLYCGECIKKCLEMSKKCPSCREPNAAAKLNRIIANTLNGFEFSCNIDGCNLIFNYESAAGHFKTH